MAWGRGALRDPGICVGSGGEGGASGARVSRPHLQTLSVAWPTCLPTPQGCWAYMGEGMPGHRFGHTGVTGDRLRVAAGGLAEGVAARWQEHVFQKHAPHRGARGRASQWGGRGLRGAYEFGCGRPDCQWPGHRHGKSEVGVVSQEGLRGAAAWASAAWPGHAHIRATMVSRLATAPDHAVWCAIAPDR